MATSIVSQPTIDDIVSLSAEASGIASLMIWINAARAFIDKVDCCASIDSGLADRLKAHDLCLHAASWEGDTAAGMEYLLLHQHVTIGQISDASVVLASAPQVEHPATAARSRHALSQSLAKSV